jgi:hypothetical protein
MWIGLDRGIGVTDGCGSWIWIGWTVWIASDEAADAEGLPERSLIRGGLGSAFWIERGADDLADGGGVVQLEIF